MREWKRLWRYRTPIDPDYGGPTSTITLWLDNLGGLVLFMDERDGEKVIGIPIPSVEVADLAAALHVTPAGRAAAHTRNDTTTEENR